MNEGWLLSAITLILFVMFCIGNVIVTWHFAAQFRHKYLTPIGWTFFILGWFIILYPKIRIVAITCYQWISSYF